MISTSDQPNPSMVNATFSLKSVRRPPCSRVVEVDQEEALDQLVERVRQPEADDECRARQDPAAGEERHPSSQLSAAQRGQPRQHAGGGGHEGRLPGQGREGDHDPGHEPVPPQDAPQRQQHQQRHRGLLAGAAGRVGDEPLEGEEGGGAGDARQPRPEDVAAEHVEHPHDQHRQQEHQHPHPHQVVGADRARSRPPRSQGTRWASGPARLSTLSNGATPSTVCCAPYP